MPKVWSKTEAFDHFGVQMTNTRWSWSGVSDNGEAVVVVLWQDRVKASQEGTRYDDDKGLEEEWRKRTGSLHRTQHLKHAVENCGGKFHAVIAIPKDKDANPREIDRCFPQQGVLWTIDEFDEHTGAFRSHAEKVV